MADSNVILVPASIPLPTVVKMPALAKNKTEDIRTRLDKLFSLEDVHKQETAGNQDSDGTNTMIISIVRSTLLGFCSPDLHTSGL